ncbi:hypothetical protein [uncultured Clostridium sp.]|uniref:hypothetical protein n=1 Tax=uncultured Clostridium sp. TaxID=59620 RepID=UPI0026176D16|nr:hypothetical protein [uncultured Clostridium sp.]
MEYLGVVAFVCVMCYSSYPEKVKKLESKIKKFERELKGDKSMSKILSELVNKRCILVSDDGLQMVSKRDIECTILDIDDEWIKFIFTDKKGINKTQLIRIDSIERVSLIQD